MTGDDARVAALIGGDDRFVVPVDVLSRRVGGDVVLLHLGLGEYFSLGGVGARIWTLVAGGAAMDEVVRTVCDEYDVPAETARRDAVDLLTELLACSLLRPARRP